MAIVIRNGFCKLCGESRKVERDKANHLLHFFLSIITVGIWLIVWLGLAIKFGGWRCSTCGSTKISNIN